MSLSNILREYGNAFRVDWLATAIDGRGVHSEMGDIATWVESPDQYPGDAEARTRLGVCPYGLGHWAWPYCDEECARDGG